MKGGLSLESNETAQFVKDGVSVFENNSVGTFNPTLNFISRATTILTNEQLKTLALGKGNKEIDVVIETSMQAGMIDLNHSLLELVRAGEISIESAYEYSLDPKGLERAL
jgi:hypothetical protein